MVYQSHEFKPILTKFIVCWTYLFTRYRITHQCLALRSRCICLGMRTVLEIPYRLEIRRVYNI